MATGYHYFLIIKWQRGYYHHDAAPTSTLPPKTLSFDAPWVDTEAKALEFAQKQATKLAGGEVPDSTLIDLGDTPTWVQTGDRVNTFGRYGTLADQRVVSRKVTRFNNGHAKLVPTLGSPQSMLIDRIDNDLRIAATGTSGGSSTSAVSFRNTDSGIQSGQLTAPSTETWSWTQVGEEDTGAGGHVVEFNEPICITLITISFSAGVDLGTDVPIPVNDLPGTVQFRYYLNDVFLTYTDVPPNHATWRVFGNAVFPGRSRFSVIISSTGTNTLADLAGVRATMKFDTAPGWLTRENVEVRTP